MQLEKMITEGSNAASAEIDRVSTLEMCRIINDEDKTVPLAVERVLPDIAAAIDVIHAQVSGGGRLIYIGFDCWRRICHSARGGRRGR